MLKYDENVVRSALHDIGDRLSLNPSFSDVGLLAGSSGQALFFWYLSKQHPDIVCSEVFDTFVSNIQDRVNTGNLSFDIATGISGIACFFELVLQEQDEPYDPEYNTPVDVALEGVLRAQRLNMELEYVTGLAGVGVYAARRAKAGQGVSLYKSVIGALDERAEWVESGTCTWPTPRNSRYRIESGENDRAVEFNFGLAHGVPSVIASMLPALAVGETRERAAALVRGGCNWLVQRAQDVDEYGSHFPYTSVERKRSRLGWCYGDLGIALTLARAGVALGEDRFIRAARDYGRTAARRVGRSEAHVRDSALCHGSAGLALMFLLLFRAIGGEELLTACQFWLDDLQSNYSNHGLSGLDSWCSNEDRVSRSYAPVDGLLEGYSGIGLALLACTGQEPDWADLLLLK